MIELNKYRLEGTPVNVDGVSSIYVWGDIHGDISKQEDLKQILDGLRDAVEGDATKIELEQLKQWVIDQHYLTGAILEGYATEEWVESKGYLTEHQDISMKADKTYVDGEIERVEGLIPTLEGYATESWVESKGYLTEHQDISMKADKSDTYTKEEVNDLIVESGGGTKEYVDDEIKKVEEKIPTKTSDLTNDSGYLTEHQDISGKADKTYVDGEIERVEGLIPTLEGYATESWVENKHYLTEHQSLDNYYTKSEIDDMIGEINKITEDILS